MKIKSVYEPFYDLSVPIVDNVSSLVNNILL